MKKMQVVNRLYIILYILAVAVLNVPAQQVQREITPVIDYSRTPRTFRIANIEVDGVQNYDEYLLVGLSGLTVGQPIEIPGE